MQKQNIKAAQKKYYLKNRDSRLDYQRNYTKENKDKIADYMKKNYSISIPCECGKTYTKYNKTRHMKSIYHQKKMDELLGITGQKYYNLNKYYILNNRKKMAN